MLLNALKVVWKIFVFVWKVFWGVVLPIALIVGLIWGLYSMIKSDQRKEAEAIAKWEETRHIVEYQTPITGYTYDGHSNGVDFYIWYVDSTGEEHTYEIPEEQWLEYAEHFKNKAEIKVKGEVGIDPRHTYVTSKKNEEFEKTISVEVITTKTEETKTE